MAFAHALSNDFGRKAFEGLYHKSVGVFILQNRVIDTSGVYICKPEIEMVLLLVRNALKLRGRDCGRSVGEDNVKEYNWLIERCNLDIVSQFAEQMIGRDAAHAIVAILNAAKLQKKSQLKPLRHVLLRYLAPFTGFSRIGSCLMRWKRESFWLLGGLRRRCGINNLKASRRVSPGGGLAVSFLGCDGAGKSTTLSYIKKEFGKKIDVATIYFGSGEGSSSFLRKPLKLVAKKMSGKGLRQDVEKLQAEKKKTLKSQSYSFGKLLWAITLAAEKKEKLHRMTKARNNGLLVLTDRYPQTIICGMGDGPLLSRYLAGKGVFGRIARWEFEIYKLASANPPDLVIKLTVPTEVAIQRKPEMTVEEIERKKEIVRQIDVAPISLEVDTSVPFEDSCRMIMKAIWSRL